MSQTNANDLRNNEVFFISPSNNTNKVLDKISQSEVKLWNKLSGANQKWRLIYDTNKQAYKIKVMDNTSLILTWDAPLSSVSVKTDTNTNNQYWYLLQDYISRNVILRNYMNPNLVLQYNTDDTLIVSTQTSSNNQFFKFSNCIYETLNNRNCKLVTAMDDNKVATRALNSDNVLLYQWQNGENQKWLIYYDECKNAYQFKFLNNTNKVLVWSSQYGNNVKIYPNEGYDDEYWIINYVENNLNQYVIKNYADHNKVLTVLNASTANDTNIIVYDYSGTTNEHWKIVYI